MRALLPSLLALLGALAVSQAQYVTFQLQITRFVNSDSKDKNGAGCDVFVSGCDIYFDACLSTSSSATVCNYAALKESTVWDNVASFSPNYIFTFTPTTFWINPVNLQLRAWDDDVDASDLVETIRLNIFRDSGTDWSAEQAIINSNADFYIKYRAYCSTNYFGPLCNVYCKPQDDINGHYTCSSTGSKVCMNSYTGTNCEVFCPVGYKCVGGVTTRCDGVSEFQDQTGQTTCKAVAAVCTPGSFQSAASTFSSNRVCTNCATGFYQPVAGETSCLSWSGVCSVGKFQSLPPTTTTDRACSNCAQGTYQDAVAQSACKPATVCTALQFQSRALTPSSDRVCTAITRCIAGTNYETQNFTLTSDRVCTACQVCRIYTQTCTVTSNSICNPEDPCSACASERYRPNYALCETQFNPCTACAVPCAAKSWESTPCTTATNRVCTACTTCGAGTFTRTPCGPASNTVCSPLTTCAANEFELTPATATSNRVCKAVTPCPQGAYEFKAPTSTSDRICDVCSAGTVERNGICTKCSPGTYTAEGSVGVCSMYICPAGTADEDSNPATPCTSCKAGFFSGEGSTACTPCAIGFTDDDRSPATACVACNSAGLFVPASSSGPCSSFVCPVGTTDDDLNSKTACVRCPAGSYTTAGSIGPCSTHLCDPGTVDHDNSSSTDCFVCNINEYSPQGATGRCLQCAYPQIDDDQDPGTRCVDCGQGYHVPVSSAYNLCMTYRCSSGTEDKDNNRNTACTVCEQDFFDHDADPTTNCVLCKPGNERTSPLACSGCPRGKTDHDLKSGTPCTTCNAGTYVPGNSTGACTQFACKLGTADFDSNPATPCISCPFGKFQNKTGETGCNNCTKCDVDYVVRNPCSLFSDTVCVFKNSTAGGGGSGGSGGAGGGGGGGGGETPGTNDGGSTDASTTGKSSGGSVLPIAVGAAVGGAALLVIVALVIVRRKGKKGDKDSREVIGFTNPAVNMEEMNRVAMNNPTYDSLYSDLSAGSVVYDNKLNFPPCYFGVITREEAESELAKDGRTGSFLVRGKPGREHEFVISVHSKSGPKHFNLDYVSTGTFSLNNVNMAEHCDGLKDVVNVLMTQRSYIPEKLQHTLVCPKIFPNTLLDDDAFGFDGKDGGYLETTPDEQGSEYQVTSTAQRPSQQAEYNRLDRGPSSAAAKTPSYGSAPAQPKSGGNDEYFYADVPVPKAQPGTGGTDEYFYADVPVSSSTGAASDPFDEPSAMGSRSN